MFGKTKVNILCFSFLLLVSCFLPSHGFGANYPLEIIQPQANLDVKNRFYKAYPGLNYNVRPAVIGGAYPFTYSLATAPSGMTINSSTGEITWSNPTISASPYNITVSVTDAEKTTVTRSWTITVTTSGFYFIDAVNGKTTENGGTGTLANPWKTIQDAYGGNVYAAKTTTAYRYGFLYFRSGTYPIDGYLENGDLPADRMALVNNYKPQVWLAYPGESPTIDVSAAYICLYGGSSNIYFGGLEFTNISNAERKAVQVSGDSTSVTFYKNDFHGTTNNGTTNMAHVFISHGGSNGLYWSFQNNLFHDSIETMAIEGYDAGKVLVEDNSVYNITNGAGLSHGFGPKSNIVRWDIRHNSFWNNEGMSIWLGASNGNPFNSNEIRYNNVSSVGASTNGYTTAAFYANFDDSGGPIGQHYIYRNTFVGPVTVRFPLAGRGPFNFDNNVLQNSSASITTADGAPAPGVIVDTNNLKGTSGIVDASGNLTSSYSSFVGTKGWQIGTTVGTSIQPPNGLKIILN